MTPQIIQKGNKSSEIAIETISKHVNADKNITTNDINKYCFGYI